MVDTAYRASLDSAHTHVLLQHALGAALADFALELVVQFLQLRRWPVWSFRNLLDTVLRIPAARKSKGAWTPDVSQSTIVWVGVVQGIGLGFLFVPLSTVTLATLSAEHRTEGAGLYSLSRNIGSSVGISVVNALLTRNTQANHADIAQHVTAVN